MRRYFAAGLAAALPALLLLGCSGKKDDPNAKPTILCTTTIVADVVREVAGPHQTVEILMPAGTDPHTFDPSPNHARMISQAKIIFYSGLNLEGKLTNELKSLKEKKKNSVYAVTDRLDQKKLLHDEEHQGHFDPHVWFDASLWAETAAVVADALAEYDPAHAADYRANAAKYQDNLRMLHEKVKSDIASIPKDQRVLATAHDAFRYFSRAYDIEVKAIQGVSTEDEAGLKEINNLVQYLTKRKIKAVFVESSVPKKNVEALKEGCEKSGHKIVIGGELFSDSLAAPDKPGGTYLTMMIHNLNTIVDALK